MNRKCALPLCNHSTPTMAPWRRFCSQAHREMAAELFNGCGGILDADVQLHHNSVHYDAWDKPGGYPPTRAFVSLNWMIVQGVLDAIEPEEV